MTEKAYASLVLQKGFQKQKNEKVYGYYILQKDNCLTI